jgi:hypothetical protein
MKTAFFAPRTLTHLPADNLEALAALCTEFERFEGHARQLPEHHDDYVEALGILGAFATAREAKVSPFPEIGSQRHQNIANISAWFTQLRNSVRAELTSRHAKGLLESKTGEYMSFFAKAAIYEFSESDFKRVQDLINELRDLLRSSSLIGDDQKRRLLRRLEAMRSELHKKTNDIERFWGFLGEAAIAIRKFGEDLKPISERVLELGGIVLRVILEKEGVKALPELARILSPPEA